MRGFPSGSAVKNLTTNAGDAGLVPGLGRSPGVGNGNLMDREAWWASGLKHFIVLLDNSRDI